MSEEPSNNNDKMSSGERVPLREKHKGKKEESYGSSKSHKKDNKKKKWMKKVMYYETDSSPLSTSGTELTSSKRQERKPVNQISFRYPCISKRSQLFLVQLGKSPQLMVKIIFGGGHSSGHRRHTVPDNHADYVSTASGDHKNL